MDMSIIGQNQTVSPVIYGIAVREACHLPETFVKANQKRIDRAYGAGEPVWMIAEELRMVFDTRPIHKPMKTPRALAVRSVLVGG
jgi:hypothetical protein